MASGYGLPHNILLLTPCFLMLQTAGKDISELEVLKVTLQPKDGIMMLCKPRC